MNDCIKPRSPRWGGGWDTMTVTQPNVTLASRIHQQWLNWIKVVFLWLGLVATQRLRLVRSTVMVPASFVTRVHLIWNQLSYLAAVAHKECYRAIIWLMIIWMLFEAYCIIRYHNLIPFKIIYDVNDRSLSKVILSVFETYDHKLDMETISHWCTWCTCLRLLPARVYPHRFARAVLDIVETLKATCRGQPQITHGQTLWRLRRCSWHGIMIKIFGNLLISKNCLFIWGGPKTWGSLMVGKISFQEGFRSRTLVP